MSVHVGNGNPGKCLKCGWEWHDWDYRKHEDGEAPAHHCNPEERLRIASVVSGLLGFTEGVLRGSNAGWAVAWRSEEEMEKLIRENGQLEQARKLLRDLQGEDEQCT